MTVKAFRIENFMCFEDSGWVKLRPLTLFYGYNLAGKSAFLRSLLLLRQSLASQPGDSPLIFVCQDGYDFGGYPELVHNHEKERAISFWFQCALKRGADDESARELLSGLGIEGTTVKVQLSYGLWPDERHVALVGVTLRDGQAHRAWDDEDEPIWQAKRLEPGIEPSWHFSGTLLSEPQAEVWRETMLTVEKGFFPKLQAKDESSDDEKWGQIQQLLSHLDHSISSFFKTLNYLGPLRAEPQRFYYVPRHGSGRLARNGQHIVRTLLEAESANVLESINEWLAHSRLKVQLEVKPLDEEQTLYKLLSSPTELGPFVKPPFQANIREVSLAVSQILPVVAQTLLAPAHSTLLLEQPELHLHPGAQAELGDLLIEVAVRNNVCLLVESHSETLFLRMRRRIIESSIGMISPEEPTYLPHDALAVYFVHKEAQSSTIEVIEIGGKGQLLRKPVAFKGFFSDDLREVALLTQAQLSIT